MKLGDFRTQLNTMITTLNGLQGNLASADQTTVLGQYTQFGASYRGVQKELAELFPGRCPRLNGDAAVVEAVLAGPPSGYAAAAGPAYGLNAGLYSLSQALDVRIREEGPDQLVGLLDPETDQPSITGAPLWDSDRTQQLATRACAGCHSNQPNLPWYTNLAPLSWVLQHQVDAGRAVLNFSEWDRPQLVATAHAAASVQSGSMPPAWFARLDRDLQLSDSERTELVRGLLATLNGVR
jgi:hypothetical protein